jgi:hypothetical protein
VPFALNGEDVFTATVGSTQRGDAGVNDGQNPLGSWLNTVTVGGGVYRIVLAGVCWLDPSPPCYANCDGSTVEPILNVEDFTCFINEFAAGLALPPAQQTTHYANCDGSTTEPALNVEDFICFIDAFAQGCP